MFVKKACSITDQKICTGSDVAAIDIGSGPGQLRLIGGYRAPSNGKDENFSFYNTLRKLIQIDYKAIVIADFNAHLSYFDKSSDAAGYELEDFCTSTNKMNINISNRCKGKHTYTEGKKKSTIDYVVANEKGSNRIEQMEVDEEKVHNVGSDHNMIIVTGKNISRYYVNWQFKGYSRMCICSPK